MLEEYLDGIGFSDKQIKNIEKIYPLSRYSESTLLFNFKNLYHYFRRNGLDNTGFISIIMTTPTIVLESIENLKLRMEDFHNLGFHRIDCFQMIKKYPYLFDLQTEKMKNKISKLQDLSFPKENVLHILAEHPILFRVESASIKKRFQFFLDFGYSEKETISLLSEVPELFDLPLKNIQKKIDEFQSNGFQAIDIVKITCILPSIYLSDSSLLKDKLDIFYEFGFSDLDINQIIKKVPTLLKEPYLESIENHFQSLLSLGFTKEDVIFMVCNNPYLLFYSNENITSKIQELGTLGITLENVLKLCRDFSILLGYDSKTIQKKYLFYREIGLEEVIISNSKILLYPLELIQNRYLFLSRKMDINKNHYSDLFLEDLPFYQKYKISKDELLKGEF